MSTIPPSPLYSSNSNATIPLPLELRTQILIDLLVSDNEFVFYQRHPSSTPGTLPTDKTIFNTPVLLTRFTKFSLVSKQMREEARKVFFEHNHWVLEIALYGAHPYAVIGRSGGGEQGVIERVVRTRMNTAEAIRENWGETALFRMRSIGIRIKGADRSAERDTIKALESLVGLLKRRGSVRHLVVDWRDFYAMNRAGWARGRRQWEISIRAASRRKDGTRETDERQRIMGWAAHERILEPVLGLRPLCSATVVGCVTDQWAEYLEKYLRLEGAVPEFASDLTEV